MAVSPIYHSPELMGVISENCFHRGARREVKCVRILQVVSLCLTLGAGVPNIAVGLKFGRSHKSFGLGIAVIVSNFCTRFFTGTWAYWGIIRGEIGSDAALKRLIAIKRISRCQEAGITLFVFLTAFFAQTPRAAISYQSNNSNLIYPILTYIGLVAVPAWSLRLSIIAGVEFRKLDPFEHSLYMIRQNVIKQIQICRSKILGLTPQERLIFVNTFALFGRQSAEVAVKNFFVKVCTEQDLPPRRRSFCDKVKGVISRTLSAATTVVTFAAQLYFYYGVGKSGSEPVWNNDYFCNSIGAVSLISNIYVTAKVTRAAKELFDQILFNPTALVTGNSVCSVLVPRTRGAIGLAMLAAACLATGTMAQNANDYFKGTLASILEILVPMSAFLLSNRAINEVVDELFNEGIRSKKGLETEKSILQVDDLLDRFNFIIDSMSLPNFAKLLNSLPDEMFATFVNGRITRERLNSYLTDQDRSISMTSVVTTTPTHAGSTTTDIAPGVNSNTGNLVPGVDSKTTDPATHIDSKTDIPIGVNSNTGSVAVGVDPQRTGTFVEVV